MIPTDKNASVQRRNQRQRQATSDAPVSQAPAEGTNSPRLKSFATSGAFSSARGAPKS